MRQGGNQGLPHPQGATCLQLGRDSTAYHQSRKLISTVPSSSEQVYQGGEAKEQFKGQRTVEEFSSFITTQKRLLLDETTA